MKKFPIAPMGMDLRWILNPKGAAKEVLRQCFFIAQDEDSIVGFVYLRDDLGNIQHHVIRDLNLVPPKGTSRMQRLSALLRVSSGQLAKCFRIIMDDGENVLRGTIFNDLIAEPIMATESDGIIRANRFEPQALDYDYQWLDKALKKGGIPELDKKRKDDQDRLIDWIDDMLKGYTEKPFDLWAHKMENLFELSPASIDLYGLHGCGKSTLAFAIQRAIGGHGRYIADIENLGSVFAEFTNIPTMVVCDEAGAIQNPQAVSKWNLTRSKPEIKVNQKYMMIRDTKNCGHYILTVNPGKERVLPLTERRDVLIDCYETPKTMRFFDWVFENGHWEKRGYLNRYLVNLLRDFLMRRVLEKKDKEEPYFFERLSQDLGRQYTWRDNATPRALIRYTVTDKRGAQGIYKDEDGSHRESLKASLKRNDWTLLGDNFEVKKDCLIVRAGKIAEFLRPFFPGGITHHAVTPLLNIVMAEARIKSGKLDGNTVFRVPLKGSVQETLTWVINEMIRIINERYEGVE